MCETSPPKTSSSPHPTTRLKSAQKRYEFEIVRLLRWKTDYTHPISWVTRHIVTVVPSVAVSARWFGDEHFYAQVPTPWRCGPHLRDIITGLRWDLDGQGATAPSQTWPCTDLSHRDQDLGALIRNPFQWLCHSFCFLYFIVSTRRWQKHASSHSDCSFSVAPRVTINFNNIIWTEGNFTVLLYQGKVASFLNYFLKVLLSWGVHIKGTRKDSGH